MKMVGQGSRVTEENRVPEKESRAVMDDIAPESMRKYNEEPRSIRDSAQASRARRRRNTWTGLQTIIVAACVIVSLGLTVYLFQANDWFNQAGSKSFSNIAFTICYFAGLVVTLILTTGIVVACTIRIARFIQESLPRFMHEDAKTAGPRLSHGQSYILAFAVIFLSYGMTDFNIDDLANWLGLPSIVAKPFSVLFALIALFVCAELVSRIIDAIVNPKSHLRLELQVFLKKIYDMFKSVFGSLFKFISFIPDFLTAVYDLLLSEEEDLED